MPLLKIGDVSVIKTNIFITANYMVILLLPYKNRGRRGELTRKEKKQHNVNIPERLQN